MAIELELDTNLKFDGKEYPEGTSAKKLPKAARDAARAANSGRGIFRVQRVEEADLEAALAELDDEDEKPKGKAKAEEPKSEPEAPKTEEPKG